MTKEALDSDTVNRPVSNLSFCNRSLVTVLDNIYDKTMCTNHNNVTQQAQLKWSDNCTSTKLRSAHDSEL